MLKKVHILEPEKSYEKEAVQCYLCETALTKTILYVCESGHVVCEACRAPDEEKPIIEKNNAISTAQIEYKALKPKCRETGEDFHKVLASGDHQGTSRREMRPKSKSVCHISHDRKLPNIQTMTNRQAFSEEGICSRINETKLQYKNVNFCNSDSSVSNHLINDQEKESFEINNIQRPVTCPVTDCHKILARYSVLQHFYFDHSKVPRITINESEHHRVFIQIPSITERVVCYAVLLVKSDTLPHGGSGTLMNGGYKNSSFLLMGGRMPSATEIIKESCGNESVQARHTQKQTSAVKTKNSKVPLKTHICLKAEQDILQEHDLEKDGAIMLWICKLGDSIYFYSISVKRPDKRLGFSFTGETITIRDSQDRHAIWNQFDHLYIRNSNIKKLTNKQDQLEVNVNIFK